MLARVSAAVAAQASDQSSTVAHIRRALELLGRASQDWRNGVPAVPGALHWPVAVRVARDELAAALETLGQTAQDGQP